MSHALATSHRAPPEGVPLSALLEIWVADGIISAEQRARIAARGDIEVLVDRVPRQRATRSLATEALGYLGGVVVVVSTILIANLYWQDLSLGSRLAVVGVAAAGLFGGGLAVPRRLGEIGDRLRSVLWLASTVSVAGFLAILGAGAFDLTGPDTAVLTSTGTAVAAAGLWWAHRHLLQQIATMVALMAAAAAVIADYVEPDSLPGVGAWLVGLAWLALGLRGSLTPRHQVVVLSAAAAIVGSLITLPTDWGFVLALVTIASVVALAVQRADLLLLAVGALGTLVVLPAAANEWFPGSVAVPFVLLGVGLLLVSIALWTARRHRDHSGGE